MKKYSRYTFSILLFVVLAVLPFPAAGSAQFLTSQVSPEHVPINITYNGAKLKISGQSMAGDDLIVRITSASADAHYKYMGKASGLFWMKKGDISFKNVPGVYMLFSTRDLDHLLDAAEQKKNLIGYEALKETAEIETENEEIRQNVSEWQNEFVRFKQKENLYSINAGTVVRQHGQDSDTYQVEADWPFQAAPGSYTIEVMAIRNGKIAERAASVFTVERAGVVSKLSDLAFNKAPLYGMMAVIIAIMAGFAVGLIFKKGGGAH